MCSYITYSTSSFFICTPQNNNFFYTCKDGKQHKILHKYYKLDEYVRYVYVVFLNKLEMQGQFFKKSQEIILRYEKTATIFLTKKQTKKQTTT